jgi:ribA/ribD-fused uncharacterized protein
MSNFIPCTVFLDGLPFSSVEHAYVAAKTTVVSYREDISRRPYLDEAGNLVPAFTSGQVKRLGRKLKLRPDWEQVRVDIMRDLLIQKFSQAPFRAQLVQTGKAYLEETNVWHDTFWGVCEGVGENHLGWLLMEIRDGLNWYDQAPDEEPISI